jgi:MFS family permease
MTLTKRLRSIAGYGALEESQFRLLWLGRTASSLGDALIPVALAFAVIEETGSATDLGFVMASYTLARVALIVAGGVWADRLPRRLVMLAADLVRAGSQGVVAFLLITDAAEIWQLALGGAIGGGAQAFFGPASTALVPDTVRPERLQQANALISMTGSGTELFGPALSGVLVASVGPGWVFAIDAGTFAISAAFLLVMRVQERRATDQQPFLHEVVGGLREIAARAWLSVSLVTFAIGNVTIASYFVLGPLIVEEELGGARDWGLVLTGGAAGGVLATLVALRYKPRRPLLVGFALLLIQPVSLLTLIPPLPTLGLAVAAGIGYGAVSIFNVFWETVLQEQIPRRALSRVSSIDWMVSLVFMPIGYTITGPLSDAIGVDETLLLATAISNAAILLALFVPSLRALTRLPSPASGSAGESPVPGPLDPLP